MLTKQTAVILGALLLGALVLFWIFVGLHSSFHTCINEAADTYYAQHQTPGQKAVPSVPIFHGYVTCAGAVARHDGEAITALATALLSAITLGLVLLGLEQSKTTRAQLRAYAMVGSATTYGITAGQIPSVKIQIKNFGQTPAYNLRAGIGMGFSKWPFTDVDWPTFEFDKPDISERPIAPGDDFFLLHELGRSITAEQIIAMHEGRWAIWVIGKVKYKDAFGDTQETEFCFFTTKIVGVGQLAAVEGRNKST